MAKEEKRNIPKTLEEAIIELDKELSSDDKSFLLENGSLSVHHSLGRWIRNNWGFWGDPEYSELKKSLLGQGFEHPDDMSNYIIEEYITHLKLL